MFLGVAWECVPLAELSLEFKPTNLHAWMEVWQVFAGTVQGLPRRGNGIIRLAGLPGLWLCGSSFLRGVFSFFLRVAFEA